MANKIQHLECTLMDLGTEMFRIKNQLTEMQHRQHRFSQIIEGLRAVLDERGVIEADEFDLAVDLSGIGEGVERATYKDLGHTRDKKELN